jgi:hypothetical protein
MSSLLISHPTLKIEYIQYHQYTQLKITSVLSLSPLFTSPKYNANMTIEGSCDIPRFLIFSTHFANFLQVDATCQCYKSLHANANPS